MLKCNYSVFSSRMANRTLFQMCGRLYLPMFLLRVGSFTLMYMASWWPWPYSDPPLLWFWLLHCWYVASNVLMLKNRWWSFQVFFVSLFKSYGWFPIIFIITLSPATLEPIYDVALLCYGLSVFLEHQQIFQSVPSFGMYLDTISATDVCVPLT